MALVQKTKWIVFMEDFTGLEFKEDRDPTIENFDFAIPVTFMEKERGGSKRAERLSGVILNQGKGRGVVTLG